MKQQALDVSVSFDPYYGEPDRDGNQGADILPDGRVHFRILAKDAKEVVIDQFGTVYPLEREKGACGREPSPWAPGSCISS